MGVLSVPAAVRAILLDIEGTTTPIAFVKVGRGRKHAGCGHVRLDSERRGVWGRGPGYSSRGSATPCILGRCDVFY